MMPIQSAPVQRDLSTKSIAMSLQVNPSQPPERPTTPCGQCVKEVMRTQGYGGEAAIKFCRERFGLCL